MGTNPPRKIVTELMIRGHPAELRHAMRAIDVDGTPRSYPKSKIVRHVLLSQRCLTALRDHLSAEPPAGSLGHLGAVGEHRRAPARYP